MINSDELDAQKTKELITQVLKDENENYFSSDCITEKPMAMLFPVVTDFNVYVMNLLNIKDTLHYQQQLNWYKKFKITENIVPGKNILTQKDFEQFKNSKPDFWDWLEKNCEKGYCSISKPIFNETFDLAYIRIRVVCGIYCGSGEERIYEFINGNWIVKESLGSWVS